jgi:hypothetical protein
MVGLFGGGKVDITIDVDGVGPFRLGDTVNATITIGAEKGMKAREVRAGLVLWQRYQTIEETRDSDGDWRTSHTWRTDEEWLHRETLLSNEGVPANFQQTYQFAWPLPYDSPAPCQGKIVQIKYLVKVTVDRAMARDLNEEYTLPVASAPPGRDLREGEYGRSTDPEAKLRFWLPKLEYVEGEEVTGRLTVEPRQAFDAREIRVELVRRERVTPGDKTNNAAVVECNLQLAPSAKLQPGQTMEFDFSLPIPANGNPSHESSKTRLVWQLEGIVNRPLRDDTNVEQEVYVFTAPGGEDIE